MGLLIAKEKGSVMLKQVRDLTDGDCVVVAKSADQIKHFKGVYDEMKRVVFFAVPSHFEVVGYLQD